MAYNPTKDPSKTLPRSMSTPAGKYVPAVVHATDDQPDGTCDYMIVGTAGTASMVDETGALRTNVPLQAGPNPLRAMRITALGSAANIWFCYVEGRT